MYKQEIFLSLAGDPQALHLPGQSEGLREPLTPPPPPTQGVTHCGSDGGTGDELKATPGAFRCK